MGFPKNLKKNEKIKKKMKKNKNRQQEGFIIFFNKSTTEKP